MDAASDKYSKEELFAMGEGFFKLDLLDKLVVSKIKSLNAAHPDGHFDEVEIRLAYQKKLAVTLDLPAVTQVSLYGACEITDDDIREAERQIKVALGRSDFIVFIAKWMPWQNTMKRLHPEAYEMVQKLHEVERDALAIQPRRMSEYEWMQSLKRLQSRHTSQERRITARLTREFLETHEPEDDA